MRIPKEALIAQLDRVQVSEACGVGSSPAERTNLLLIINNLNLYTSVFKWVFDNENSQVVPT